MNIAIIGAGPSGMAAAIQAARRGGSITLFEQNAAVGRKLQVTGSGRCNITNQAVAADKYVCADPAWMDALLDQFGLEDLLSLLSETGILVTKTSDGWYYPLSNSAQTVVDAFSSALERAGVMIRLSNRVTSILPANDQFRLKINVEKETREETYAKVIVAGGGKAYPNLGSYGALFPILKELGHTIIPKRPALAPVLADLLDLKSLQGVRLDVGTRLWKGQECLAETVGNMIFTQWGLNGPAVMDISHAISANAEAKLTLSISFIQPFETLFLAQLEEKRATELPVKIFLGAFLPPKVVHLHQKILGISDNLPLRELDESRLQQLIGRLKDTRLPVKGVRGFEYCQVSAGGVPVGEVNPLTLESRLVKGLYLVGETVDVVGPCGGYNLHYAFASGALAGRAAGTCSE